jgi:dUTP pyrophosphatase
MDRDDLEKFIEKLQEYEETLQSDENVGEDYFKDIDETLAGISNLILNEQQTEFNKLTLKFVNNSKNPDPTFANEGDSGFDLRANLEEPITLLPFKRFLVPTGLHFQMEKGFEIQVRPRSGLAVKNGITVLNTPGTVDSHYRGEVKVPLINLGEEPFVINNGDRIAQGVLCPVFGEGKVYLESTESLNETTRGAGGFGSSGIQ